MRIVTIFLLGFALLAVLIWVLILGKRNADKPDFTDLEAIDVHAHVLIFPPVFEEALRRLRMRIVNICYINKDDQGFETLEPQQTAAIRIFQQSNGAIAWCSTFDPQHWERPEFVDQTIAQTRLAFEKGAVGIKIHKSIGMSLKSNTGRYLLPDDPKLAPIFSMVEAHKKTLFAHVADPTTAWQPLRRNNPHYRYYKNHPEFHLYMHPERPRKETILESRDRILKRHSRLRTIGCHLGSMEDDLEELGRRFELYQNFAVDTATALNAMMLQPRERARAFLMKYSDRVLYGTDLGLVPWKDPKKTVKHYEEQLARDYVYLATNQTITFRGQQIQGLDLPESVLRNIYRNNALKWIPDLATEPRK